MEMSTIDDVFKVVLNGVAGYGESMSAEAVSHRSSTGGVQRGVFVCAGDTISKVIT